MSKKEERSKAESEVADNEKNKNSESENEPSAQEDPDEKPFDFGGLPNRDLKRIWVVEAEFIPKLT